MADLPETNLATNPGSSVEPPWLASRVEHVTSQSAGFAIPVGTFAAIVTGAAVQISLSPLYEVFHLGGPYFETGIVGIGARVLPVFAGLAAGVLTILHFLMQLDREFTKARLLGQFRTHSPSRCQSCQAPLVAGQMVCDGCGRDLRTFRDSNQPSLRLRRRMLHSYVLGTIPLGCAAFVVALIGLILASDSYNSDISEAVAMGIFACAYAAVGLVVLLRLPRAIELWRLVSAEEVESRFESK